MSAAADEHEERTLGQLFAAATSDMSALVHDEIALAKAELRADAKKATVGGTAFTIGLSLILFGIPVLSFAFAYFLRWLGLGLAWSFLITFGVHVVIGTVIVLYGIARLKRLNKPEKAIDSARRTVEVISGTRPGGRTPKDGRPEAEAVARSTP
jgi:uncharacterized membrane protein YcjF (UPF0283 family)